MAALSKISERHGSFSYPSPKKQKSQAWDPTNLLGFSYLEEEPMEVSSILRRLPCLTKRVPDRLFHPPSNSECKTSSDEPSVSSQSSSPASNTTEATDLEILFSSVESDADNKEPISTVIEVTEPLPSSESVSVEELASGVATLTLDPTASQYSAPTTSTTSDHHPTTLAVRKRANPVRFVDGLKDKERTDGKCTIIIEYLEDPEQRQELIREFTEIASLNVAIVCLKPNVLSRIAFSLGEDRAANLTKTALEIRQEASMTKWLMLSAEDPELGKRILLRFLDEKTIRRYLCRDCDLFHCIPDKRCDKDLPQSEIACASHYVIGHNKLEGRVFHRPFRFSQIQVAMKLYRHDMPYGHRLVKPLHHTTVDFDMRLTFIRTSEVDPVEGRLLSRIQYWFHSSPDIPNPLSMEELVEVCRRLNMTPKTGLTILCRHLNEKKLNEVLWDFENPKENPDVGSCDMCALEYRYDWYDEPGLGSGIVLTIYRDFGRCLTPFDPRWMAHFEEYEDAKYIERFSKDLGAASSSKAQPNSRWHDDMEPAASTEPVGYIQKLYEANAGFDLKECIRIMKEPEREQLVDFVSLPEWRSKYYVGISFRRYQRYLESSMVERALIYGRENSLKNIEGTEDVSHIVAWLDSLPGKN